VNRDAATEGPLHWHEALIERIVARTQRAVSVFVRSPIGPHEAGQHVDVRLTAPDGYQAERSYSIASAPGTARLELLIERLDDGEVSPYFHEIAQPGDTFEIRGPIGGHFVWRQADGGPLLLIGGGSGVVPLLSMLRYRALVRDKTPTLLVYSARTLDEMICRDELANIEMQDPTSKAVLVTTRADSQEAGDYSRRLDASSLHEILARWGRTPKHVYLCGSNRFVESIANSLTGNGISPASIRTERYGGA